MAGCGNSIVRFEVLVELHIGMQTSPEVYIMSKKEQVPEKSGSMDVLLAVRKREEYGNAFKVTNDRGQLSHVQTELSPLLS